MHDESHDGFEVVTVECHLTLFGHVDPPSVPRSPATTYALHPLAPVGSLEGVDTA